MSLLLKLLVLFAFVGVVVCVDGIVIVVVIKYMVSAVVFVGVVEIVGVV